MERKRDSFFLADKKQKKVYKTKPEIDKTDKRQSHFNKNRPGLKTDDKQENGQNEKQPTEENTKKPFDKKTYRLKKYSNKYKLEQWEEQRKKKLLRNYYKEIKNDPIIGTYKPISFDEDITDGHQESGKFVKHPDLLQEKKPEEQKKDPFWRAKEQYKKIKEQKLDKNQEKERAKVEREAKLMEYKKKKHERFKKLSKKTKKGQPVMTGRLELLLEKIQKTK